MHPAIERVLKAIYSEHDVTTLLRSKRSQTLLAKYAPAPPEAVAFALILVSIGLFILNYRSIYVNPADQRCTGGAQERCFYPFK